MYPKLDRGNEWNGEAMGFIHKIGAHIFFSDLAMTDIIKDLIIYETCKSG